MKQRAPYGSWRSPILSELIVQGATRLSGVVLDGTDIYLGEQRPSEAGRTALLKLAGDGGVHEVTDRGFSVRTAVHEYGGGAFTARDAVAYFSNYADHRLYRAESGHEPRPITPGGRLRYAAPVVDSGRRRVICVVEDHDKGSTEPENRLAGICMDAERPPIVLASGADFYASPRLSPAGDTLAWLCWRHPNMPWDGTELWVGALDGEGNVVSANRIAGGDTESIFQPEWGPDGVLYYASDRTGFWNLYRWPAKDASPLCRMEAEFGLPQWIFEMSTYAPLDDGRLVCTYRSSGKTHLALLEPETGRLEPVETDYTEIDSVRATRGRAVFGAASPVTGTELVSLDIRTKRLRVLHRFSTLQVDPEYVSRPEPIEFATGDGETAYGLFYRPKNPDFDGPPSEKPPLVVKSHGGPTATASTAFNMRTQYLTTRGIAVVDVDYRGSAGYGRRYREALNGQWGIADVEDCVSAALHLTERGDADPARLAITGGSAGGYTTLAALTFRDVFRAGASHYGISDLEALARDTHKFESRYLDRLIGPYPDERSLYVDRSPIHHASKLSCPVIFFQGLEDRVVPPNQAERMVEALREKGIPVAYVPFEAEQHGFRRAENIRRAIDGELYFFSRVFGFRIADEVEAVPIDNL